MELLVPVDGLCFAARHGLGSVQPLCFPHAQADVANERHSAEVRKLAPPRLVRFGQCQQQQTDHSRRLHRSLAERTCRRASRASDPAEPRRRFRRPGREAAHWIWTGCGSMVWFLDLYTQFSTARGDQCQQRKNLAPNRKSSRRVIWTGDPCETDTILTSMVEANAFTLQGWGRLASLC